MTPTKNDDLRVTVTITSPLLGETRTIVHAPSDASMPGTRPDVVASLCRERVTAVNAVHKASRRIIRVLNESGAW